VDGALVGAGSLYSLHWPLLIGRNGGEVGGCELGVTKLPLSDQEENGRLWGKGGGVWLVMKEGGVCASMEALT